MARSKWIQPQLLIKPSNAHNKTRNAYDQAKNNAYPISNQSTYTINPTK